MARNKILLFILPVVGLASIAGTGFAAWYFTSAEDTKTVTGTVSIENEYKGTLALKSGTPKSFDVKLDQGGAAAAADLNKGISFVKTENGSTTAVSELQATYTITPTDWITFNASKLQLKLTATLTLNATFHNYVSVDETTGFYLGESDKLFTKDTHVAGEQWVIHKDITPDSSITNAPASNQVYTFGLKVATDATTGKNELLSYTTAAKPADAASSKQAYSDMKSALAGLTDLIKVEFKVAVSDYPGV